MKKLLFGISFLSASSCFALTQPVKEVGVGWMYSSTTVSTTTVSAVPATPLSGRYKIICENMDTAWQVAFGTFSTMGFANGFAVNASTAALPQITLNLPSGTTVYAIGQNQNQQATVNVRCLEFK